jgi:hypothetical protein
MMTVYKSTTPTELKKAGKMDELKILMAKIYHLQEVESRIAQIQVSGPVQVVEDDLGSLETVEKPEGPFHPRWRMATIVGVAIACF